MHMVDLDELLHSLVDNAAEAALDGHVHNCRLDMVLCHPLQTLHNMTAPMEPPKRVKTWLSLLLSCCGS